jgi:hypothetical protein
MVPSSHDSYIALDVPLFYIGIFTTHVAFCELRHYGIFAFNITQPVIAREERASHTRVHTYEQCIQSFGWTPGFFLSSHYRI